MDVFELIGEIGSGMPHLYRVWGLLFSKNYRRKVKDEYKSMSAICVGFDILASLVVFGIECAFIYWMIVASVS